MTSLISVISVRANHYNNNDNNNNNDDNDNGNDNGNNTLTLGGRLPQRLEERAGVHVLERRDVVVHDGLSRKE